MYWTPKMPGKCPLRDLTKAYLFEFFLSPLSPIAYFQCEPAVASGVFSVTLCVCLNVCFITCWTDNYSGCLELVSLCFDLALHNQLSLKQDLFSSCIIVCIKYLWDACTPSGVPCYTSFQTI